MMSENEIRASIDHYAGDSQVRCIEGVMVRSLCCFCIYILKDGCVLYDRNNDTLT